MTIRFWSTFFIVLTFVGAGADFYFAARGSTINLVAGIFCLVLGGLSVLIRVEGRKWRR